MIHITDMKNGLPLFDALNSEVRIEILNHLKENGETNLNHLAKHLNLTNGAITAHIRKLHDAQLIQIQSMAGVRGAQKVCSLKSSKIIIDMFDEEAISKNVYSFDIGIGHYVDYKIMPTCGIVNETVIIGELDDPKYFAFPERINARLLWFSKGYVTYQLPNSLKSSEVCTELQIGMELASEAPGYTMHYPSDISFRVNGIPLGYFTSPGEFNDRRGIFTPAWWFRNLGQYGKLKLLTINDTGCFIDGLQISEKTIDELGIVPNGEITLTIEAAEDAINQGGVSVFGKGFGDYDSGITAKMFYRAADKARMAPGK